MYYCVTLLLFLSFTISRNTSNYQKEDFVLPVYDNKEDKDDVVGNGDKLHFNQDAINHNDHTPEGPIDEFTDNFSVNYGKSQHYI